MEELDSRSSDTIGTTLMMKFVALLDVSKQIIFAEVQVLGWGLDSLLLYQFPNSGVVITIDSNKDMEEV